MGNTLRNLQLALLDMLKIIDEICKDNDIQYSLACGTALGAIRHQGFIPWDDDLDIMFLREDYERFLYVSEPLLKDRGYTLQKEFTDSWPMSYSKVRKDNTTYFEDYTPKIKDLHQGIFIDLFPIDNLYNSKLGELTQWIVKQILVSKGMKKRGYNTSLLLKRVAMNISFFFPEKMFRKFVMLKSRQNTRRVHTFLGGAVIKSHNMFPREIFQNYELVDFEGAMFPLVKDYDAYLRICFGDYMELPPLENRKMHAVFFDLERSYIDYQE